MISRRIQADLGRFASYVESAREQAKGSSSLIDGLGKGGTPSNHLTERITDGGSSSA
ncbi:MAG TPA: hypothetical protein VGN81_40215 [Pseudonocardiaceae bacterium]|jgi:hypothetical protein